MAITHQQILADLKKGNFRPVYVLHGQEAYYIDMISDYIEDHVLSEGEKAFNQTIIYGKEAESKYLIDTASRYPMMAKYQVLILKEAQDMKTLKNLQPYIQKPVPTTIFVICHKHKKLDMRTAFGKAVKKNAVVLESKPLYDNQVPDWIQNYLKSKKLSITPEASTLIAEYLGTNLSKIVNELDKLAINIAAGSQVGVQEVQDNIGISKDYNVFELQKALGQKQVTKVNRIVQYFAANPKSAPFVMVVGSLYNYFSKIYVIHGLVGRPDRELSEAVNLRSDYFLREYKAAARRYNRRATEKVIHLISEYDLKAKGVNSDNVSEGELLKELVFKMINN